MVNFNVKYCLHTTQHHFGVAWRPVAMTSYLQIGLDEIGCSSKCATWIHFLEIPLLRIYVIRLSFLQA